MLSEDEIAREEEKFFEEAEKRKNIIPAHELRRMNIGIGDGMDMEVPKPEYKTTHSTGKIRQIDFKQNKDALF